MKPRLALIALSLLCSTVARAGDGAERYAGVHGLGVNRVSVKRRPGTVSFTKSSDGWQLSGEAREGPYYLRLSGTVVRADDKELVVQGALEGVPDLSWRDEKPSEHTTKGKLTFRATKGRKFWRLYEIDGRNCVCDDNCGNDFCYIDIDLAAKR